MLLRRSTDKSEYISLHTEAIRMINGRLADPERCVANATLAAVGSVALYEVNSLLFFATRLLPVMLAIGLLTYVHIQGLSVQADRRPHEWPGENGGTQRWPGSLEDIWETTQNGHMVCSALKLDK